MLSLTGMQQQMWLPLGHLAAVWNTVRSQTHTMAARGPRTPMTPHTASAAVTLTTAEPLSAQQAQASLKASLHDLGLEQLSRDVRVETLSPILDTHVESAATEWGESYVSAHSFFENKNGFSESQLWDSTFGSGRPMQQFKVTIPALTKLLQSPHAVHMEQRRGFKTRRSGRTAGIGSPGNKDVDEDHFSTFKYLRQSVFDKVPASGSQKNKQGSNHKFKSLLAEAENQPELQEKMKIAFAEGYSAHDRRDTSDGGTNWAKRFAKFAWYGLLVWLLFQLLQGYSAFGGSGSFPDVKINVLKGERYEINPEDIHVKFDDVKGVDEAKQELHDVVEFLRDPEKFKALGAKLPKGVLLVGPPGIGKTLLARAVAGEAEVPFFHASGSEFDEIFVGTGAKRVRQLFDAAKVRAPCVIFIDEIDTVGAKRTSSQIHPYANQTINQLLSEMDGFQQNEGVIVLGATNRRDNLDKALLRPGRFDVEVRVFAPDLKGRQDILEHYMTRIKSGPDVDSEKLARGTTGCTGADLENMVNQAALKAAMDGSPVVTHNHMEFAKDKVLMGPAKKTRIPDEDTNLCTAYHEAGHTLVAYYTKDAIPLHKVTIIPRGLSLGHTSFMPDKEQYNLTKAQLLAQMDVAMGGRVAEELVYGQDKVTTGAGSDFQSATAIATAMVKRYGMSEKMGVRVIADEEVESGMSFLKVNDLSATTSEIVDSEIMRLLKESYERAKAILKQHSGEHKALATALMKYETLDVDDIKSIVEGKKLKASTTAAL